MKKRFNLGGIIGVVVIFLSIIISIILKIFGLATGGVIMLIGKVISDTKNKTE